MPGYDFSKSNLLLMVGGQIMLLVLVIMVVWFGVGPLQFAYAEQMRNMLNAVPLASVVPSANKAPLASVAAASVAPLASVVPSASVAAVSVAPSANGKK